MRLSTVDLSVIQNPVRADAADYFGYALNISQYGKYSRKIPGPPSDSTRPDYLRPPGYPLFAALFVNDDPAGLYIRTAHAQLTLNALVGIFVFFVVWKISSYWFALAATFMYATSPHIINMNLYFLTESLMTSLSILLMFAIYLSIFVNRKWGWIIAGSVLAYASLTRPYIKYLILFIGPYLYYATDQKNWKGLLYLIIFFGCVYGPWAILTSVNEGVNAKGLMVGTIHHGMYPDFEYNGNRNSKGYPYRFDPASKQISANLGSVTEELLRRFKTQPMEHIKWFVVGKPLAFWQWSTIQGSDEIFIYKVASSPWDYLPHFKLSLKLQKLLHYPLVLIAFIFCIAVWFRGINKLVRNRNKVIFLRAISMVLVYSTLIHLVGAPFPRYQIPQKPWMYAMSFIAIWTLLQATRFSKSDSRTNSTTNPVNH